MTMWDTKIFTENELSSIAKALIYFVIITLLLIITIPNMVSGEVKRPLAFFIVLPGFCLFLIAKITLFRNGLWFSLGTKQMTEGMSNLYRIGYWLMVVGLIFTFSK